MYKNFGVRPWVGTDCDQIVRNAVQDAQQQFRFHFQISLTKAISGGFGYLNPMDFEKKSGVG